LDQGLKKQAFDNVVNIRFGETALFQMLISLQLVVIQNLSLLLQGHSYLKHDTKM
jgi:hypothetical protein